MSDNESTSLTQATYERLQAELEDLTTRGRVEIAGPIESARALGDLSENGDYHAAKDPQGKMEARIRQLQNSRRAVKSTTLADRRAATVKPDRGDPPVRGRRRERDGFFVGSIEECREDLTVMSPGSPLG